MKLNVKKRIAIATLALVVVNTLAASVTWSLHARATRHGEVAREQTARAGSTQRVAQAIAQFVADGNGLALAVSSHVSEDSSVAYGRIQGSEQEASLALRTLAKDTDGVAIASIEAEWESLRLLTYYWINQEARNAGSDFVLTQDANGRFRASVSSNLRPPQGFDTMSTNDLRRAVRDQSELMTAGLLRSLVRDAEKSAAAAVGAEASARSAATDAAFFFIGAAIVLALGVATWLYRGIARPLEAAREFAGRVANGELDAVHGAHSDDEIGALTSAVESMRDAVVARIDNMREMAGVVLVTAESVSEAAVRAREAASDTGEHSRLVGARIDHVTSRAMILQDLATQMLDH